MEFQLSPDAMLDNLILFSPNLYESLLHDGIFTETILDEKDTLKMLQPWSGYGDIRQKYPLVPLAPP